MRCGVVLPLNEPPVLLIPTGGRRCRFIHFEIPVSILGMEIANDRTAVM
jgi:hypothetical protein